MMRKATAPCSHYSVPYRLEACNTSALKKDLASFKMTKEDLVQLPGGAAVAFQEYGDANGVPIVFCHGWPSSCTMARLTDEPARELGVRIISPDRPGISGSSL